MSFGLSDLFPGVARRSADASPASSSETFSAERRLARILGVASLDRLDSARCAGHQAEFLSLSSERDPQIFAEGLLALARRLETGEGAELAQAIYADLAAAPAAAPLAARAEARLAALTGSGDALPRTEHLLRHLAREATEPTALLGMVAAGAAFRLTRLTVLSRLAATPGWGVLANPTAARAAAGLMAFGVEATVFPLATRLGNMALGHELDWSWATLRDEWIGSVLVLGSLKLCGWASGSAYRRMLGPRPGTAPAPASAAGQFFFNQAGQLGGILLGHGAEEMLGMRPHVDGATRFTDAFAMLLQFHAAGRLTHGVMGGEYQRWERDVDQSIERLGGTPLPVPLPQGERGLGATLRRFFTLPSLPNAALATSVGSFPSPLEGEGPRRGGEGSHRPSLDLNTPQIMMMSASGGRGGGSRGGSGTSGGGGPGYSPHKTWLRLGSGERPIHLPVSREFLPQAESLREGLDTAGGEPGAPSEVAALLRFLERVRSAPRLDSRARRTLLGDVHDHLARGVLTNDVHAATRGAADRGALIATWNRVRAELGRSAANRDASALIRAAERSNAGLFAQFGGQANRYFGELADLHRSYPEAESLLEEFGNALREDARSPEARATGVVPESFDLMAWLRGTPPPERVLASSVVSQPLIAATQLTHYFVALRNLGLQPAEMRRLLRGSTGHSQGIMASVVVAASATEAEFRAHAVRAVRYLFWQGVRMTEAAPETTLDPAVAAAAEAAGDGRPTPMLGLLKLSPEVVQRYVDRTNRELSADRPVEISLINGPRAVVVSGHPESLHRLRERLRRDSATSDQSRVPFSQRKLEWVGNYFEVYGPYHTRHYMRPVAAALGADLARLGIEFRGESLELPVYSPETGENLQGRSDLTHELIRLQSTGQVNWPRALASVTRAGGITHLLDFGPGETAGIGAISARLLEGAGVEVILAGSLQSGRGMLDKAALFDAAPGAGRGVPDWAESFRPRLARLRDGRLVIDNHFTRAYGRPPVIQAGMTPTSADAGFTAAVVRGGFHAELAGGGQHDEAYFRRRVDEIVAAAPEGEGFHVNLLFLNQYLWGFQYPLVQVLAREGRPIEGVTVAAGVPSLERATEIIRGLNAAGIRHVAFKPGGRGAILDVVRIAEANPDATVMLQWTGGRGGGHHSFEDVHDPILQTYGAIRRQENIVLVFGSGVGDAAGSLPYLTGAWSRAFGYPAMPFDGVLLGSRLMAAAEARTAPEVKDLIVATPGIADAAEWEGTYDRPLGGIRTVISELGEPIHKIATRGVELWSEFDRQYFSERDPAKREASIRADRDAIIARINADYQKLYFGSERDGRMRHLEDMSYGEVARRMTELMRTGPDGEGRWIDVTFRDRVFDFLARSEERFHPTGRGEALLQAGSQLEAAPNAFLEGFLERYPAAREQLLSREDLDFFLQLCRRPGKPVNFIPVIDGDLAQWFKRDSLWQSEDLAAVPERDVQRVAILQGPVAARYTTAAGEPVAAIMNALNAELIEALRAAYPAESDIPVVESLGGPPAKRIAPGDLGGLRYRSETLPEGRRDHFELPAAAENLPATGAYFETLARESASWWRFLLLSPRVVDGASRVDNPWPRLMRPRPGQRVEVSRGTDGDITRVRVFDPLTAERVEGLTELPVLEALRDGERLRVTLNHVRPATAARAAAVIPLRWEYRYRPDQPYAPIHLAPGDFHRPVRNFYSQLWTGEAERGDVAVGDSFRGSYRVTADAVRAFTRATGNRHEAYSDGSHAPLDLAIVAAWEPLVQTLFPEDVGGNLFNLVHRSNSYRVLDPAPLGAGQDVATDIRIMRLQNTEAGRLLGVRGILSRDGRPWVELESEFLIRGRFADPAGTFANREVARRVTLAGPEEIAVLRSKDWFRLNPDAALTPGDRLEFRYWAERDFGATPGSRDAGRVIRNERVIASFDHAVLGTGENAVTAYLNRHGEEREASLRFENGGRNLLPVPDAAEAPAGNRDYGLASGDLNPIHDNPYVADLAGLPATIVHGMWTSANARRVVETALAFGNPERIRQFEVGFEGMVRPGDRLYTQLRHVGMRGGRLLVEIESVNQDGDRVLRGAAEVEQADTAYVFTGQGSQERGMGMELYEASPVAREVWNRAERHFRTRWGFSILDVVRNDPATFTTHTVSFRGREGAERRERYRGILPELDAAAESYTFHAPRGLLNATQFTQPALMLSELAAFRDLESRGLTSPDARFAGHSLGEYAALAAVGRVLPLEELMDITFLRGMTMQASVPRDAEGRSNFGMSAVSPRFMGRAYGESDLQALVGALRRTSGSLIEIVNLNVADGEYIVAGTLANLAALERSVQAVSRERGRVVDMGPIAAAALAEVAVEVQNAPDGRVVPTRGRTIPLPGIDVPFHSRQLRDGVPAFRRVLEERYPAEIDVERLEGRYIPNLTGRPFSLARSAVEEVFRLTESPVLREVLSDWLEHSRRPRRLGRTLLIELLAYQFASPVRWIDTQEHFFTHGVERLIEFGPAPILAGMAEKTLRGGRYPSRRPREILSHRAHRELLYMVGEDAGPNAADYARSLSAEPPAEAPPPAAAVVPPAAVLPAAPTAERRGAPATPVADVPLAALDGLRALLAVKLRRPLADVGPAATIRDLVGGKSALQNEIMGDLSQEFGGGPDNAAELPLADLAPRLGAYANLGRVTQGLVARLVSQKMPAGFGAAQVRAHLSGERLLGEGRSHAVLLHALTAEPAARLGSPAEAVSWLDGVVDAYAQAQGLTIPRASQSGSGGEGGGSGAVVDAGALRELRGEHDHLVRELIAAYRESLGEDPRAAERAAALEAELRRSLESERDLWLAEHGEDYAAGIRPLFDARRFREYNSAWNWGREDAVRLYYDSVNRPETLTADDFAARRETLLNRATPELLTLVAQFARRAAGEHHPEVAERFRQLGLDLEIRLGTGPRYRFPEAGRTRPTVEVGADGSLRVAEAPRFASDGPAYVEEMERGARFPVPRLAGDRAREILETMIGAQSELLDHLRTTDAAPGLIAAEEQRLTEMQARESGERGVPYLFLRTPSAEDPTLRVYDAPASAVYFEALRDVQSRGLHLGGRTVLVTGAGPGSIGAEVVQASLRGGARVLVTTSNFSPERCDFFRRMYREHGAAGSELVLLPFNQASVRDVRALVEHLYDPRGLNADPDLIFPFAGIAEQGLDIGSLGSRSELAHRIMLTNTHRLLGEIKNRKSAAGLSSRPAQVILPLSPNHGLFGFDGLYAESKLGLESLLHKARSEGWDRHLNVSGATIGWTRGTNLMEGNDLVAPGIEATGARTFSQAEMALNLMALAHPRMRALAETEPVWADLNGGFHMLPDLSARTGEIRDRLRALARERRAVHEDAAADREAEGGTPVAPRALTPRANLAFGGPAWPSAERLEALSHLRGLIDPTQVVLIGGLGEVGPLGNHRTRWEMERDGTFSLEGTLEMARLMGLIRYHDGPLGERRHYSGWVDAARGEPVADHEMIALYGETIRDHSGIRIVEPELAQGYDPGRKFFYREVALTRDFPPFEVGSREDAESFARGHGERASVFERDGTWFVQLRAGATLHVPRALNADPDVAGQIPTGWDARRYGIPDDIAALVDPVTLYALVSTAEALVSAGITDPYELYEYVHVSEVANTIGGGMGGMTSIRGGFFNRAMERDVHAGSSNLQEQLINVVPAWVNMLLLSSSGPIRTPVGACATAAVSLELGVEAILSGKARVAVVGGFDDYGEEGAYEFNQMKATASSVAEAAAGRPPREQSRPGTSSRAGFREAHGGAVQILFRGDVPLAMGVRIRGALILTNTASDKQGRSVPAPGRGILAATAREMAGAHRNHPLLDLEYRRRGLTAERTRVAAWRDAEILEVERRASEIAAAASEPEAAAWAAERRAHVENHAARMERAAFATWSHRFWEGDPAISPLRGALAVWGLTPDDIEISSFHGTSTHANDLNESQVNQSQQEHLGRTPGHPLFTVWQKYLTGHSKGGAAGWMLNGLVQAMEEGVIPPQRNLDNVDPELRALDHLLFSDGRIDLGRPLHAGLLKSFGFGQAGAEALVIAPEFFLASLSPEALAEYRARVTARERGRYRHEHEALTGRRPLIRVKEEAPYRPEDEEAVYLDPTRRAAFDPARGSWFFGTAAAESAPAEPATATPRSDLAPRVAVPEARRLESALRREVRHATRRSDLGVGTDTETLAPWAERIGNEAFLERNFTPEEIAYCRSRPDPAASFAARWAAKEAVIKALSDTDVSGAPLWRDPGAGLRDIEIVSGRSGAPEVRLLGHAARVAERLGIREVRISLTHSESEATAVAVARR